MTWTILRIDCSATTVAEVAQLVHQRLREMEGAERVPLPGHALVASSRDGHE